MRFKASFSWIWCLVTANVFCETLEVGVKAGAWNPEIRIANQQKRKDVQKKTLKITMYVCISKHILYIYIIYIYI